MSIKRFMSTVLILTMCIFSVASFAQEEEQSQLDVYHINSEDDYMSFYLNGEGFTNYIGFEKSNTYEVLNGSTFMQLRNLGDALKISLYWHQNTQEVSFDANGESVVLKLGSKIAYVGDREVILNAAPYAKKGRTFVPLRFVSEALGIKVNYIDMRPEGEFAKQAIMKNYPSIKRMIDLGSFKQGNKYIKHRLIVSRYDPETNVMGMMFEEVEKYSNHKPQILNWFDVNIQDRTVYDPQKHKITVDWYEKENNKDEDMEGMYNSNLGKERNIPYRVKDYIANGQDDLSNAEAFWWDDIHLEALTDEVINNLYGRFLESGGNGDSIKDFAGYLSMNAPAYPQWKEVFEARILSDWEDIKIIRYDKGYESEYVAVYIEGFEPVFVNVNTITGHYRG